MNRWHPTRWPLRTRVALAFLAATGLALTVLGVFVQVRVGDALEDRLRETVSAEADRLAALAPADLLARWREGRAALADALLAVPEGTRIAWFGPPMSPTSMATARLMETWAHGLDVADALGAPHSVSDRMQHVVHLGVRTRNFAFSAHGLEPPAEEFRVELVAPGGETWTYGPEDAAQTVRGSAYHFCLLVTQRRHRADLDLVATGADADRWLDIAQAFAGPPGAGREPAAGPAAGSSAGSSAGPA